MMVSALLVWNSKVFPLCHRRRIQPLISVLGNGSRPCFFLQNNCLGFTFVFVWNFYGLEGFASFVWNFARNLMKLYDG